MIFNPGSVPEALRDLAMAPDAVIVGGGTDLMPRINALEVRPRALLGLARCAELRQWGFEDSRALLGAGMTWARLAGSDIAELFPALAAAARQAGPAYVRNSATLGGNLLAVGHDPDALTVLAAYEAIVLVASAGGVREVAPHLLSGPGQLLRPGELVLGVRVPVLRGGQHYVKVPVGPGRPITLAFAADPAERTVRCAVGGAHPGHAVRAAAAEQWLAERLDPYTGRLYEPARTADEFGQLVAAEVRPGGFDRTRTAHRAHVVSVCARRAVLQEFNQ
jgi:CO/xanthine dehydrogenase FAD-binding subunit